MVWEDSSRMLRARWCNQALGIERYCNERASETGERERSMGEGHPLIPDRGGWGGKSRPASYIELPLRFRGRFSPDFSSAYPKSGSPNPAGRPVLKILDWDTRPRKWLSSVPSETGATQRCSLKAEEMHRCRNALNRLR